MRSNARRSSKDTLRGHKMEDDGGGSVELSREEDERETIESSIVNFEEICNFYPPRTEIVREPLTKIYDAVRFDQGKRPFFL